MLDKACHGRREIRITPPNTFKLWKKNWIGTLQGKGCCGLSEGLMPKTHSTYSSEKKNKRKQKLSNKQVRPNTSQTN